MNALILGGLVAILGAACASAGGDGDNGGDPDAAIIGGIDADPNAPDADPNAPDANTTGGDPDANTGSCPTQPCDLVEQCGCPTGEACDLNGAELATGGTECRGVNAQGQEASTCSNVEDCASGYVCLGSNPGQCRKYCATDTECTGAGSLCLIQITYGTPSMDVPGAKTCTKDCDPVDTLNPTGCPTNMGCHIYVDDPDGSLGSSGASGDERWLTDCTSAGGGTDGADCSANGSRDCAAGYDCVNLGGNSVCKQNCVYPGGTCAVGGCTRYSAPRPVVGGIEYGVCN
jgi:hypothetical protein